MSTRRRGGGEGRSEGSTVARCPPRHAPRSLAKAALVPGCNPPALPLSPAATQADEPSAQTTNGGSNGALTSPRGTGAGAASNGGLAHVKAMASAGGGGGSGGGSSSVLVPGAAAGGPQAPQEALLSLLPVLTSLDGGWWVHTGQEGGRA